MYSNHCVPHWKGSDKSGKPYSTERSKTNCPQIPNSLPKREEEVAVSKTVRPVIRQVYPQSLVPEWAVTVVDNRAAVCVHSGLS